MRNLAVLNVVGLSGRLLGEHTPRLNALAKQGSLHPLRPVLPAVTCSVQASMLTGTRPSEHGIVGNGWYFRDLSEMMFWRQSAGLYQGERIWEAAKRRDPQFTCAKMFWWYNMYDSADVAVTPRPSYPADGRKIPDIWASPVELRAELSTALGQFPLFNFWGPNANIKSSKWIARSAEHVHRRFGSNLTLVYLPHLDYCLQKFGPDSPAVVPHLKEVDTLCGELIDYFSTNNVSTMVLSEYAITPVTSVIHINRALREAGFITVREELGLELLDAGASAAFAVADHQIAHVYVKSQEHIAKVKRLIETLPGVARVFGEQEKKEQGLDHPRSGELIALSKPDSWFSYYYWLNDAKAPDFARCVDIHRKPGYDPVELFFDPKLSLLPLRVAWKLLKKALGFRTLLDVIPLDASLVRGSHGLVHDDPLDSPVLITPEPTQFKEPVQATQIKEIVLAHLFNRS
ncbi:MAG TPA: alkaline phosphatase family protein [Polyangiaceae bacterium]|jgi:predicted AlkP superfamily pyrophosphatase or phosphodiesterase|nr:alkaline phosphatase family protein [Polyangiaceae bacterium]